MVRYYDRKTRTFYDSREAYEEAERQRRTESFEKIYGKVKRSGVKTSGTTGGSELIDWKEPTKKTDSYKLEAKGEAQTLTVQEEAPKPKGALGILGASLKGAGSIIYRSAKGGYEKLEAGTKRVTEPVAEALSKRGVTAEKVGKGVGRTPITPIGALVRLTKPKFYKEKVATAKAEFTKGYIEETRERPFATIATAVVGAGVGAGATAARPLLSQAPRAIKTAGKWTLRGLGGVYAAARGTQVAFSPTPAKTAGKIAARDTPFFAGAGLGAKLVSKGIAPRVQKPKIVPKKGFGDPLTPKGKAALTEAVSKIPETQVVYKTTGKISKVSKPAKVKTDLGEIAFKSEPHYKIKSITKIKAPEGEQFLITQQKLFPKKGGTLGLSKSTLLVPKEKGGYRVFDVKSIKPEVYPKHKLAGKLQTGRAKYGLQLVGETKGKTIGDLSKIKPYRVKGELLELKGYSLSQEVKLGEAGKVLPKSARVFKGYSFSKLDVKGGSRLARIKSRGTSIIYEDTRPKRVFADKYTRLKKTGRVTRASREQVLALEQKQTQKPKAPDLAREISKVSPSLAGTRFKPLSTKIAPQGSLLAVKAVTPTISPSKQTLIPKGTTKVRLSQKVTTPQTTGVSQKVTPAFKQGIGDVPALRTGTPTIETTLTRTLTRTPSIPKTPATPFTPIISTPVSPPKIPPATPFLFPPFPALLPRAKGKPYKSKGRKGAYAPSLGALIFGITGKKPKRLTGLEVRPIQI